MKKKKKAKRKMKPSETKSTTPSSSIASFFKQPKPTKSEKDEMSQKRPSDSAHHECRTMPSPPKKKLKTAETSSEHKVEKENKETIDCHHHSKGVRNNCSLSEQELNSIFENESELLLNQLDMFESKLAKSKKIQTPTATKTSNEDCKEFPPFLYLVRNINKFETNCLVELLLTRIENEQSYNELSRKIQIKKEEEEDELSANDGTRCNLHDSW